MQQCPEIWLRPFPRLLQCKSVKASLDISYDEEIQNYEDKPPRSRSGKRLMAKARSV